MTEDRDAPAEQVIAPQRLPAIVIIEERALMRTCIANLLRRELAGFEIVEMVSTSDLDALSARDVRLVAFNIGDRLVSDPCAEDRVAHIEEVCPNAHIALLSDRDDELAASAAMRRGVHGFFPSSIAVEVAIAGLRLVLAGAVYRPLPMVRHEPSGLRALSTYSGAPEFTGLKEDDRIAGLVPKGMLAELTPREQHVLAALKLGLPNKLIAVRLNLSENTVKMHIQRIMRKCRARNRTEAVLRWSGQSNGHVPSAPSSS